MTNRTLHSVRTGTTRTTLELKDTNGSHHLSVMHEQGATLSGTGITIPSYLANAMIAATPAAKIDGGGWVNDPAAGPAKADHRFDWEKRQTIDPKLLRDALTVALTDAGVPEVSVAAERAAVVVERLLDPGNQVEPWTPSYAVSILKARQAEDAIDPTPHAEAAARGVLGLPFPEEPKREGATVNLDWQPTPPEGTPRISLSKIMGRAGLGGPPPGPVMYGSPWTEPFDEAARAKAAEIAADDATIGLLDTEKDPWAGGEYEAVLSSAVKDHKKTKEAKVKKDKSKGKPEKPGKKVKDEKEDKGNSFGRRIAVLRYVVEHLDGNMPFPDGPHARGFRFYTECVRSVEKFIENNTVDALIYDPRGEAPSFGFGTPLDLLTVSELLDLAADVDATSFEHEREPGDAFTSLEAAVKGALHAIYVDVWSVIAHGIAEEELTVDSGGQLQVTETPEDEDDEEPDEDAEHALTDR